MSDISLKLKANELGKDLENLAEETEAELNDAVKNLAHAAYAQLAARVQAMKMNAQNRQAYLKGLDFMDLGENSYLITLNGDWPNMLEEGFSGYDMKDSLLNSTKTVTEGSRAGQSWVQKNKKDGSKFAHVPFQQKPFAVSGDLQQDLKAMTARNMEGAEQRLTKTFKDPSGKPISGKVATARSENPLLDRVTKYQKVSESGRVQSIYMTFRTISENSEGWRHPGFGGYGLFEEIESYVETELDRIIEILL